MADAGRSLQKGDLIRAPFLRTEAQVTTFEHKGSFFKLEVVLTENNEFKSFRLTQDQLGDVQVITENRARASASEDLFFLVEASRIRLAFQFDPLLAVNTSQIDPLPHQIDAVYHHALDQPIVRFLIADDPGAGKTIMAGLILKELQYRQKVKRVLIVAPGRLKYQWQREMKEKFRTSFKLIDRNMMRAHWSENVWREHNLCVTSIDFIKQEEIRNSLIGVNWDLVIVDEAHKMSAYAYDTREGTKIEKTMRYQVGEVLSEHTDHYLFLTATPHKGDEEHFRLFLDLLKPGFFAKAEQLRESVKKKDNPLFIRRLKERMRGFDGQKLFPPRNAETVTFKLTPEEQHLYNEVTRYVENHFDQAKDNRHISFTLMLMQRRLTSSTHAILETLKRRKERLEELKNLPELIQSEEYREVRNVSEDEMGEMSEEERWEIEQKLERITIAENIDDVIQETDQVERLIEIAKKVREQEVESKLIGLRDKVLQQLRDEKLLVFTEFKDTLWYLVEKLRDWGYDVCTIHGGMPLEDRIDAENEFKHNAQILVATEAAGEGINLQFCSWMVNYDIPWNPNRLEQRMGRIHRYGQHKEVFIYNMVSTDTREGKVLDRLFERLTVMRKELGDDRVFDVIGDLIPGTTLDKVLQDAAFGQRTMDEILEEVEQANLDQAQDVLDKVTLKSLATEFIDYSGLQEEAWHADEERLVPEYIEDYFLRIFPQIGGEVKERDGYYRIQKVPYELRKLNEDYDFKTAYGKVYREYSKATFDKSVARNHPDYEFIAPGHPLLEAVNELVFQTINPDTTTYHIYGDMEGREGVLWFVEGTVEDGFGEPAGKRIFCIHQSPSGSLQKVHPSILWDLEPLNDTTPPNSSQRILENRDPMETYLFEEVLLPFKEEIEEERKRDAQVKTKYGLRSLEYQLTESSQKLLEYEQRKSAGEDMRMAVTNEERRYKALESKKEKLEQEIQLEQNVTLTAPEIIGSAILVPHPDAEAPAGPLNEPEEGTPNTGGGVPMKRDDELEAVGMQVTTAYELDEGWEPRDVSDENLGFDVRSIHFGDDGELDDVRYIEVKARAQSGEIRLSSNEWRRARRFGRKYWLYIVTAAATNKPRLSRIRDPAGKFVIGEDIFEVQFGIPREKWEPHVEETK